MLAERGIDAGYETSRRWVLQFCPAIAANVRSRRVQPSGFWHLVEVIVRIGGKPDPTPRIMVAALLGYDVQ